jgi:hypothetical protein
MIDTATGVVLLSAGAVAKDLTLSAFLDSPLGKQAELILANREYRTYQLAQPLRADERPVAVQLLFTGETLSRVSLALMDGQPGSSWDDWSEARERSRKDAHTSWLRTLLDQRKGPPRWRHAWGDVESVYDAKGGGSSIVISYR